MTRICDLPYNESLVGLRVHSLDSSVLIGTITEISDPDYSDTIVITWDTGYISTPYHSKTVNYLYDYPDPVLSPERQVILRDLINSINVVEDFPSTGVSFKDISPLLNCPTKFRSVIEILAESIGKGFNGAIWEDVTHIVGIESRGFILASALAFHLGKGLILVRKEGKLPPPVHSVSYSLEYGDDNLELIDKNYENAKVVVVDDVLASGGTLEAANNLIVRAGMTLYGNLVLIKLKDMCQKEGINHDTFSLIEL